MCLYNVKGLLTAQVRLSPLRYMQQHYKLKMTRLSV